jgi:hypothetical protein
MFITYTEIINLVYLAAKTGVFDRNITKFYKPGG